MRRRSGAPERVQNVTWMYVSQRLPGTRTFDMTRLENYRCGVLWREELGRSVCVGRAMSGTHIAMSAYRVMPIVGRSAKRSGLPPPVCPTGYSAPSPGAGASSEGGDSAAAESPAGLGGEPDMKQSFDFGWATKRWSDPMTGTEVVCLSPPDSELHFVTA